MRTNNDGSRNDGCVLVNILGGKKMNTKIVLIFVIGGLLLLSGCTSKPTYSGDASEVGENNSNESAASTTSAKKYDVVSLDIFTASMKNWDADPAADGIEVTIEPQNVDGTLERAPGTLTARAYHAEFDSSFDRVKTTLIKEWVNIPVSEDGYGFLGSEIRLEFDDSFVIPKDPLYLEIDFIYDGQTYSAIEETIYDFS